MQPPSMSIAAGGADKIGLVVWSRGKIWLGALGLLGFGAVVGAGSVNLLLFKQKIQDLLRLQRTKFKNCIAMLRG